MVPTLKIPKGELQANGFINGYVKDNRRESQYKDSIYLLFQPIQLDKFREFLDSEYERTKNVIEDYDYEDGFVVIVYKLEVAFKPDFDLVKKGKYSKTSPSFQNSFPKIVKIITKDNLSRDEISLSYKIFNRTQDLIAFWEKKLEMTLDDSQELWTGFEEENETLDLDKIKKNVTTS